MRPRCYNRAPYAEGRWFATGRRLRGKPVLRWSPRWFVDRCAAWDGVGIGKATPEYPDGQPYPVAHGWDCTGCIWRPKETT